MHLLFSMCLNPRYTQKPASTVIKIILKPSLLFDTSRAQVWLLNSDWQRRPLFTAPKKRSMYDVYQATSSRMGLGTRPTICHAASKVLLHLLIPSCLLDMQPCLVHMLWNCLHVDQLSSCPTIDFLMSAQCVGLSHYILSLATAFEQLYPHLASRPVGMVYLGCNATTVHILDGLQGLYLLSHSQLS